MKTKKEIRNNAYISGLISVACFIALTLLPYGLLAIVALITGFLAGVMSIACLFNVYIEPGIKRFFAELEKDINIDEE